jgi:hypothetical protein
MTSTIKDRLLLITIWVVACLVVWPTGEWPVNDDWAYVRAVQNLRTGAFHYEDWQGMPLFSQVLFGYPFLGLGGDGFLALRIPMMVLALFGGLVLHAILRLRGVGRWRSGIGALLLLFNPVFFHLSLSFMTDVFALTFCLVAFFHMERFKLNGYSRTDGLLAMIFLAIAVLNRPTALVLPVGMIVFEVLSGLKDRMNLRFSTLALLTTISFLAWHDLYFLQMVGRPVNYGFQFGFALTRWTSPSIEGLRTGGYYLLNFLLFAGLSLLPLTIALFRSWTQKEVLIVVLLFGSGLARIYLSGNNWPFTGDVWHAKGVGAMLFPDHASSHFDASWYVGSLLALVSAMSTAKWLVHVRLIRPSAFIVLGSIVPLAVIYLSDRYFVFALAFLILLVVPGIPDRFGRSRTASLAMVAALFLFSVNEQVYFHGTRKAARELAERCTAQERKNDLNGGFEWNGYQRFDMAEYRMEAPGSSWPGSDRLRITPADEVPGFIRVDSIEVRDMVGLKAVRMGLFRRVEH